MNQEIIKDFNPNECSFRCPHCGVGLLKKIKETFHSSETQESLEDRNRPDWEPEFIQELFVCILKCNHCNDIVTVNGWASPEPTPFGCVQEYHPLFFNPPLDLFHIHEKCPDIINNILKEAFSLFWSDIPACANRMRTAVEALLTVKKVKRFFCQNNKRKVYPLHHRIGFFSQKNSEVGKLIMAIKWIGNDGSHDSKLTKDDLLKAFEIFELVIEKLYVKKEQKLSEIANKINKNKGI